MPIKFNCGEDSYFGLLTLTLCSVEAGYQRFTWTYILYFQGMSWIWWQYAPLQHCFTGPLDYILCITQKRPWYELLYQECMSNHFTAIMVHAGTLFYVTTCITLRQDLHGSRKFCACCCCNLPRIWSPCILVQCTGVNIRFVLIIIKEGDGMFSISSQTCVTSNSLSTAH